MENTTNLKLPLLIPNQSGKEITHNEALIIIDNILQNGIIDKDLYLLEILRKYVYSSNQSGCVRMKDVYKRTTNFDYEDLREWLENDLRR